MSEQTSGSLQEPVAEISHPDRPDNAELRAATATLRDWYEEVGQPGIPLDVESAIRVVVAAAEQSILSSAVGQKPEAGTEVVLDLLDALGRAAMNGGNRTKDTVDSAIFRVLQFVFCEAAHLMKRHQCR
jgi:hypothetical protein